MASTSPRDVALTLSVDTVGAESIDRLRADIDLLAKQGGTAAPELKALADQVANLSEQSKLTANFGTLTSEIEQLTVAEQVSASKAADLQAALTNLSAVTATARSNENDLRVATQAAQRALFDKRQELALLKNETQNAEKEGLAYTSAVRKLNSEILSSKTELRNVAEAYRASKDVTREAAKAESDYASSIGATVRGAADLQKTLQAKTTALGEVRSALVATGAATKDIASAEQSLITSYQAVSTAVNNVRAAQEAAAAAAKRAAQEDERLALIQINSRREVEAASALEAQHLLADYAKMEAAQRAMADSARASGQAVTSALGAIGVRSVAEVRAEIERVRAAMVTLSTSSGLTGAELAGAMRKGEQEVKTLEREIRALNGQMTLGDRAAKLFSSSMGQFAAGNLVANAVMLIAQRVTEMGRAFVTAIVEMDQLRRGLGAVYGDATTAANQIDFLRKTSLSAGVSMGGLTTDFVKFSASMKSANIPLGESNALFKSVATASAALGLGTEATSGALNALGQMASKGVVSMEELRQQLGDRLPGVMGATAKGFGVTEAQLIKLVESGGLAFRDFIVPFTRGMNEMKGEVDGMVPTWERFKTALSTIATSAGDSGWAVVMAGALKGLGAVVGGLAFGLSALTEILFLGAKAVVAFFAALRGDVGALDFLNQEVVASRARLVEQKDALLAVIDPSSRAAKAATDLGAVQVATAQQTAVATTAVKALADGHVLSASAAAIAGNANLNLAANIVQYKIVVAEKLTQLKAEVEAHGKLAKAAKEEGDAMVTIAKLTGDSTKLRQAESAAAELHASALAKLTAKMQEEVDLQVLERQHIVDVESARGTDAKAVKVMTDALDIKIAKSTSELEQSKQTTAAATAEATARKLAADALNDNSAKMDEYGKRVGNLTAKVQILENAQRMGVKVDTELKAAREQLAIATNLYKDAVADSIAKVELETKLKNAGLTVDLARLESSAKHYTALANEARAIGDTNQARYYEVEALKAQRAAIETKIKMVDLEVASEKIAIELKKKAVDATTEEGKAKLKQLEIELKLLEIKTIGNKALKDQVELLDKEIAGLISGNDKRKTSTEGRDKNANAINNEASALERSNAAAAKAIELENKRRGVDKDGFSTDKSGQKIVGGSTLKSATGIMNFLREAGIDDPDEVKRITNKFLDADGTVTYANNRGQLEYGGDTVSMALLHAAEQYTLFGGKERVAREKVERETYLSNLPGGKKVADASASDSPSTASSGGGYTVNVNLNGTVNPIRVASQADADTLAGLLKNLSSAAGRVQ